MFFNLTDLFGNGTITSAEYSSCELIRTAVVAQTFKTLSLTFSRNVTRSVTNITIAGTTSSGSKLVVSIEIAAANIVTTHPLMHLTCHFMCVSMSHGLALQQTHIYPRSCYAHGMIQNSHIEQHPPPPPEHLNQLCTPMCGTVVL